MTAPVAQEALGRGDLDAALAELESAVRAEPASSELRVFLFQLLSVLGQWDRALTQLNVAGDLDPSTLMMVQTYRELLQCEPLRAQIMDGQRQPVVFGEPLQWVAELIEALRLAGSGDSSAAIAMRERAFDEAPTVGGTIDGQVFEWIADADSRLGPVLEAVVNGKYCWVPFVRIRRLEIEEPSDLRDLVWLPATLTWTNEGQSTGMIPTRYCGSAESVDSSIRLSRRTEWDEAPDGFHGVGQRMLATDGEEYPIAQVRVIELDSPAETDGQLRDDGEGLSNG